ncbi:hypothetical protein B8B80_09275 [Pseudomonas aeruginosa]|nr:hypothetical protein B8B76_07340 [Pseudomonas aeruginosa]AWM61815.1 hypothetical protein C6Y58_03430 [Stutzerimonas stutzeri]RHW21823.1 hypothetical protein C2846_07420 [Pseudomonas jilinensis]OPD88415.1 hypothetical protein AO961_23745 [Pseudomonas aeruginosa]OPE36492.1 hypothetical protein APB43_19385 [Pseudomonas aeruginosa]
MRPDTKVQKVCLYPKPVDFRKSINGLPLLFVFLNRTRSQDKILYWERKGFCLWLKRLEAERFKTKHNAGDTRADLDLKRQVHAQVFPEALSPLAAGGTRAGVDVVEWLRRL